MSSRGILTRLVAAPLLAVSLARAAASQSPTPAGQPLATVSGIVRDSIGGMPMVGALVQLVAADSGVVLSTAASSDSAGKFSFANVRDGRYTLGFFHPLLDSLGITAPLREVRVVGGASLQIDLAIPGPSRVRSAICRSLSRSDSGAV